MFVSTNFRSQAVNYVKANDKDFFAYAVLCAQERKLAVANLCKEYGIDWLKQHTPVCFFTKYSKQTGEEEELIRATIDWNRARRKFICCDVDLDAGDEVIYNDMQAAIKEFAEKHNTPLIMYPTVSYPQKPRFRFVLFPSKALNFKEYWQAVTWIYAEIGYEPTDDSDYRMNANRNLPIFYLDEQVDACWNNLDTKGLKPLDHKLWKGTSVPPAASRKFDVQTIVDTSSEHSTHFDEGALLQAAQVVSQKPICAAYETFWLLVRSLAASVKAAGISHETAMQCLDIFASAAKDGAQQAYWQAANRDLFERQMQQLEDPNEFQRCKPLSHYKDFVLAIDG